MSTTFNPKSKNLVIKDWCETKKVEKEVNGIKVVSTIPLLPRNDENLDSREEGELVYSLLDIAKGGYFTKFLEKFQWINSEIIRENSGRMHNLKLPPDEKCISITDVLDFLVNFSLSNFGLVGVNE